MRTVLALVLASACSRAPRPPAQPDAALPSCAAAGCPARPSGDPRTWTPCEAEVCYCPIGNGRAVACRRGSAAELERHHAGE